jgi:hypothetical protein
MPGVVALGIALICLVQPQRRQCSAAHCSPVAATRLTGLYRIDLARSDKLYSVVAGVEPICRSASSRSFLLTSPSGSRRPTCSPSSGAALVTLASSRRAAHYLRGTVLTPSGEGGDGQFVNTRAALRADELTVSVSSRGEDKF